MSSSREQQQVAAMYDEQEEADIVVIEDDSDDDDEEEGGDEEKRQCKPLAISMVDDDDDLSHEEYHDEYHDDDDDDDDDDERTNSSRRQQHQHRGSRLSLSAKKTVGVVNGLVEQDHHQQKNCCNYYWICAPAQRRCWLRFICLIIVPLTILPVAMVWLAQPGNDISKLLSLLEGGHHQQEDAAAMAEPGNSSSGSGSGSTGTSSLVHTTDLVMSKTQLTQIQNYKNDNALMVNLHIGFHGGGSTFCYEIGKSVNEPGFSCTLELDTSGHVVNHPTDYSTPQGHYPWTHKETATNIQQLVDHKNVHMISWSLQKPPLMEDDSIVMLQETDWEHPRSVSVLLVQDPMVRIVTDALAHSKRDSKGRPLLVPGNSQEWWAFAEGHSDYKDNLALRIYSDGRGGHSHGTDAENRQYLVEAQALIKRFTIVLDAACIDEGMAKLAEVLDIRLPQHNAVEDEGDDETPAAADDDDSTGDDGHGRRRLATYTNTAQKTGHPSTHHHSMREAIGDDEVYDYLVAANKWDMELYEWSKGLALVQCQH